MPLKKKKYNARFPPGRIKKIMQTDEEVGKVAAPVPIMISRALELFAESLLTKTMRITNARHAKTLSTSHMRQCIMSENRFDFLRELVKNVPDINMNDDGSMENSLSPNPHLEPSSSMSGDYGSMTKPSSAGFVAVNGNTSVTIQPLSRPSAAPGCLPAQSQPEDLRIKMPNFYKEMTEGTSDNKQQHELLRKKLTEMTRKSASVEFPSTAIPRQIPNKLARYDSSPAAFSNSISGTETSPSKRNQFEITITSGTPSTSKDLSTKHLLPPPIKIKPEDIRHTPVVKIDYSQLLQGNKDSPSPSATPVINIELSNFTSNGSNKLLTLNTLGLPDNGFSTPTLTTPTRLNHIQFGSVPSSPQLPSTSIFPLAQSSSLGSSSSALEMDEDYDNI